MAPPTRSVAPGDPSTPNQVDVDPPPLYYLVIDGTNEVDSATFGEQLQTRFQWKNLVSDLDPAPDDKTLLVDATHPFLLVRRFMDATGCVGIHVVTPEGAGGVGQDAAWAKYSNDEPVLPNSSCKTGADGKVVWRAGHGQEETTFGRHTACEQGTRFVPTLMLRPRLVRKDFADKSHWVFADMNEPETASRKASMVYVSSHGWLGGFMSGEAMLPNSTARPAEAQAVYYSARRWFLVGRESTMNFQGPLWVVLGQCSTLNSATWALWAKMMAGGSPVVRGILGYEEVSPGAFRSAYIARKFFGELAGGKTFIEAWKSANVIQGNSSEPWAAIVHVDAIDDKMEDFRSFKALTANAPSDLVAPASYLGFLRSIPAGQEIRDVPPTFNMALWNVPWDEDRGSLRLMVTPDKLASGRAQLEAGQVWEMVLTPGDAANDRIVRATVEMIHIRPTYPDQIPIEALFDVIVATTAPTAPDGVQKAAAFNKLTVACPNTTRVLTIRLGISPTRSINTVPHLQSAHSYVWWRITLETVNADPQTHNFRMHGLLYG